MPDACFDLSSVHGISKAEGERGLRLLNAGCAASPSEFCPYTGWAYGASGLPMSDPLNRRICNAARRPRVFRHPILCLDRTFEMDANGEELQGEEGLLAALAACDAGNLHGCARAGWLLSDGKEVPQDAPRARELLQLACDAQIWHSCHELERLPPMDPTCPVPN